MISTPRPSERRPKKVATPPVSTAAPRQNATALLTAAPLGTALSAASSLSTTSSRRSTPTLHRPVSSRRQNSEHASAGGAVELTGKAEPIAAEVYRQSLAAASRDASRRQSALATPDTQKSLTPLPQGSSSATHLVDTPRADHPQHRRGPTSDDSRGRLGRASPPRHPTGHKELSSPDSAVFNEGKRAPEAIETRLAQQLREAEHTTRQAVDAAIAANQASLDHMTQRRQRAEVLRQLYKDESRETQLDSARIEEEIKSLQGKRRQLVDLNRALETTVYRKRKDQSQNNKNIHGVASAPSTALQSASRASIAANVPSASQATRADYEALNRRLDAAKYVAEELSKEIVKSEGIIKQKQQERISWGQTHDALHKELDELHRQEVFVGGVIRESKQAIQHAGNMASRIPYMEKVLAELQEFLVAVRTDFTSTQSQLTAIINADDKALQELHAMMKTPSGGVIPFLVRQLQQENDALQKMSHTHVEHAEAERMQLQAHADRLQQKLSSLEDKIRFLEMAPR